jgi:hypothetical protein
VVQLSKGEVSAIENRRPPAKIESRSPRTNLFR